MGIAVTNMKIFSIFLNLAIICAFKLEENEADQFLRSRRSIDENCGSMPGGEEFCREEIRASNPTELGDSSNASKSMADYDLYSLDGGDDYTTDYTGTGGTGMIDYDK